MQTMRLHAPVGKTGCAVWRVGFGAQAFVVLMVLVGAGASPLPSAVVASAASSERSAASRPDENLGFRPPPAGALVTQMLVHWRNTRTGAIFTAPTGGWLPPGEDWVIVDNAPGDNSGAPGAHSPLQSPAPPTMSR